MEDHPGLAGWIQAAGALVTLWVAIALPMVQRRLSQKDAEAALAPIVDRAARTLARSFDAISMIRNPGPFAEGPNLRSDLRFELERAAKDLSSFPAQSIRYRGIQPLSSFEHAVEEFHVAANVILRAPENAGDVSAEICWLSCQASLGGALEALRRLIRTVPDMHCHWGEMALREAAKKSSLASDLSSGGQR